MFAFVFVLILLAMVSYAIIASVIEHITSDIVDRFTNVMFKRAKRLRQRRVYS